MIITIRDSIGLSIAKISGGNLTQITNLWFSHPHFFEKIGKREDCLFKVLETFYISQNNITIYCYPGHFINFEY